MTLKESMMRKNIRQKADVFSSVTPTGTTPLILIDSIFEKENLASRFGVMVFFICHWLSKFRINSVDPDKAPL
jgi:hypothetical protein